MAATFIKLRGSVFSVTKHVACPALIINLFDNLELTLYLYKINLVKNVT
jgi:hypothetical protein